MLKNSDWFNNGIQNGEMYYGTYYGYGEVADYQYVTTKGDSTFRCKDNDVTIKMIASTENQSVTEALMTTTHTTVTNLMNNY